jgi:Uncharacterized conserved protein
MLGISIYPTKSSEQETIEYLKMAHKLGFKRVFTSLLEITRENKEATLSKFKRIFQIANDLNMYVTMDVNPRLFEIIGVDYQHLQTFKDIGASAIRLDANFDGLVESLISYENSGLNIELNISADTGNIGNIMSYAPNRARMTGCHNFYPQRYTGLDLNFFMKCTEKYKGMGLPTAAFITSQTAKIGPHLYNDGLPTLEMHRDMDILVQAKHLYATGLIDDVIIGNAFASEQELADLGEMNQEQLELRVDFDDQTTDLEKKIVLGYQHFNRGDINSFSVRSTFVKLLYKDQSIPAHQTNKILKRGDVIIGNDSFGQYKGEVNIIKREIPNIGNHKNVVGHIRKDERFLIDCIRPWMKFRFKDVTRS